MQDQNPSYGKCGHSNLKGFIHMSTEQDQLKEYWLDKAIREEEFLERIRRNQEIQRLFLAALQLQEARGTSARYTEPPRKWRRERYHWNR